VVVNKVDKLVGGDAADDEVERVRAAVATEKLRAAVRAAVRSVNAHAAIELCERCEVDVAALLSPGERRNEVPDSGHHHDCGDGCGHGHDHAHDHEHEHEHEHHSHSHLLVYTKYLQSAVDSGEFTKQMKSLPATVYRAKGIVTFADTGQRVLFQYAYRELECVPIEPEREVHDVAVWIGEQLPERELAAMFE
jgi:G3E family GTPase